MGYGRKKHKLWLIKLLEYTGKPIFFLLTLCTLTLYSLMHLFNICIRRVEKSLHLLKKSYKKRKRPSKLHNKSRVRVRPPIVHRATHLPSWLNRYFFATFLGTLSIFISGCYITYQKIFRDLPSPAILTDHPPALSTKIYDRHGELLYQIFRDENRSLVRLQDLPPHLIQATIASEDKNYYTHNGVDLKGIARALYANLYNDISCAVRHTQCNAPSQGGSTLTQQLVKNALLNPEKSLTRKLREAYLAMWTESLYTKEQILELYFNYVPYGGTAYGIEEASHEYFDKSARDLTIAEASLLAGLPVAPTTLSPFGPRPYLAKHRQAQVLDAMVEMGVLDNQVAESIKNESITFRPQVRNIKAPHFVMYIKDVLAGYYGEDMVQRGGLHVTTTLDLGYQEVLQNEINSELARVERLNVHNAAGLITRPGSGEIMAMVGSHDFFDYQEDGQVNVVIQPRQPGSSIKPVTYTAAFLKGITPNSSIVDSPICFKSQGAPDYCPKNYDGRFHGTVTARTALASSYNIPAIKLLNSVGVKSMVTLAQKMGISTWDDPSRFGLALTLGGGEVTMMDMATVYGVFANGGTKVPLTGIVSVRDSEGNELPVHKSPAVVEVIPPSIAYQISSILSDPGARAPAFGTRSVLNIPGHPVAVKTGTTNNLRDNWTFGYTPNLLVATWVGNNDNEPMSSIASGITGASPIWSRTMQKLLAGTEVVPFPKPDKMVAIAVCPATGAVYCQNLCTVKPRTEYFVPGTEPKKDCSSGGTLLDSATTSN